MTKNPILFRQEHYVAPALDLLVTGVTSSICTTSPAFGDDNHAGADINLNETYDF